MNAKTMEGLIGAGKNMNLVNTPMKVYKEARRKGDTAAMERAMGYADDFASRADEYKTKAEEGMKEEAEEIREKEKAEREKRIEARREERKKLEDRMSETRGTDTVEISEEGKILQQENMNPKDTDHVEIETEIPEGTISDTKSETAGKPVTYTKTGEISHAASTSSDYSKII